MYMQHISQSDSSLSKHKYNLSHPTWLDGQPQGAPYKNEATDLISLLSKLYSTYSASWQQ